MVANSCVLQAIRPNGFGFVCRNCSRSDGVKVPQYQARRQPSVVVKDLRVLSCQAFVAQRERHAGKDYAGETESASFSSRSAAINCGSAQRYRVTFTSVSPALI